MIRITDNIISHFSGKKFIGKIWTYGPENALRWDKNIQLDGNVELLPGRYLKIVGPLRITVDSTFSVNGTLEISGNDTITGSGQITLGATGQIVFNSGAMLVVKCRLNTASGVVLNVPSNATLRIEPTGEMYFGDNALLMVDGALIVNGTASNRVNLTTNSGASQWSGITIGSSPSTISLNYTNISNATTAINAGHFTTLTVDNCNFSNYNIGISIIPTAHSPIPTMQITNNTFTETPNNGLGISIEGHSDILLSGNTLTGPLYYGRIKGVGIALNASSPRMVGNRVEWFKTGFSCANGSEPMLEDVEGVGNNTFSNNTYAIICDMSNANLGYDYGGNSICYNSAVDIWIDGGSKVFARNDSWVSNSCDPENPPGTFLIVDGSIDYVPCAGSCGGQIPIVGDTNGKILEGGDPMMTPVPALVVQAQRERRRGSHAQADALLRAIVSNGSIARSWGMGAEPPARGWATPAQQKPHKLLQHCSRE